MNGRTDSPTETLKVLADPIRLRILGLLDRNELSVGEVSAALGMSQSRVSNHLRHLRGARLLAERHAGTTVYLALSGPSDNTPLAHRLWTTVREELAALPEHRADLTRLEKVLRERRKREGAFFDQIASDWHEIANNFETGQARERLASHLLPKNFVLADLGCGTGYIAEAFRGICDQILCIDRSVSMLDESRKRFADSAHGSRMTHICSSLECLPLPDQSVDGALAGMVFHHLPSFEGPLAEMRRILRPGGSAVLLELQPHRESWMQEELGDRHLGIEPSDLIEAMTRAGFEDVTLDPVNDRYQPPAPGNASVSLALYIVRGRTPVPTDTNSVLFPTTKQTLQTV
ncbi:MAG: metalloregulator ArsR/SmtB family transcription factor [Planctomycetota bacterium]|jgi:ArsR family transcriptional regulator|nr:metalloregulator ArsR/SmtB family transcription factor [Planctomycetota bacterium]